MEPEPRYLYQQVFSNYLDYKLLIEEDNQDWTIIGDIKPNDKLSFYKEHDREKPVIDRIGPDDSLFQTLYQAKQKITRTVKQYWTGQASADATIKWIDNMSQSTLKHVNKLLEQTPPEKRSEADETLQTLVATLKAAHAVGLDNLKKSYNDKPDIQKRLDPRLEQVNTAIQIIQFELEEWRAERVPEAQLAFEQTPQSELLPSQEEIALVNVPPLPSAPPGVEESPQPVKAEKLEAPVKEKQIPKPSKSWAESILDRRPTKKQQIEHLVAAHLDPYFEGVMTEENEPKKRISLSGIVLKNKFIFRRDFPLEENREAVLQFAYEEYLRRCVQNLYDHFADQIKVNEVIEPKDAKVSLLFKELRRVIPIDFPGREVTKEDLYNDVTKILKEINTKRSAGT